ncbi:MAG: hypothetical protein Q7T07_12955 [Burkholderiaceae bacterium]|nr:hypothetical protein [Burkholderiaceae bacterium]
MHRVIVILGFLVCTFNATGQTTPQVRADLSPVLISAQEALQNKQFPLALGKLATARALPQLNAQELMLIDRLTVAAALSSDGQLDLAATSLKNLVASTAVPHTEKPALLEDLISTAQKQKNHAQVIQAASQFLSLAPGKRSVLLAQAQAHYFLKNHDAAASQIRTLVADFSLPNTPPEETLLRMWADSYKQLKNQGGYDTTLLALLTHYPKPAYWADFLTRQLQHLEPNSRYELDVYRLLRETGNLLDEDDYTAMIQLALKAGLPREALRTWDAGVASGVLGKSKNRPATSALHGQIERKVAEDANSLAKLENEAHQSLDGNTAAQAAELYFATEQWARAVTLYELAISKGRLRREDMTRLHLAIALKQAGLADRAKAAFEWAQFDHAAKTIGQSWVRLKTKP